MQRNQSQGRELRCVLDGGLCAGQDEFLEGEDLGNCSWQDSLALRCS